MAVMKLVTGWYWASILTFITLSVLGGAGAYFWARSSCTPRVAMWAGVLYSIAPYHLNELYQASLLSEYAACSVLPFLFAFVQRVCKRGGNANTAGLAASYALLVLTHLPLTIIGSLSVAVYALLLLRRERLWSTLTRLAVGIGLGLAASSFFWTTVIAELPWIKGNSANQNIYYDYRANFLFSPSALTNRNTWYANLLALAVLGMLLPATILLRRKAKDPATRALAVLTGVALLMTTELSRPLWLIIPKLRDVQFPWRWLVIVSLGGSILLAASIPKWREQWQMSFRPLHLVPLLGFVLSLLFIATQVVWDSEYLSRQQFDSFLRDIRGSASFKDWMPVWASSDTQTFAPSAQVDAGSRTVKVNDWQPEHREFIIAAGQPEAARVRTFYYPLWTANGNDRPLATRPAQDGSLLFDVPPETTNVILKFQEPPRVQKASVTSLIGCLAIVFLGIAGFRKRHVEA